MDNKKYNDTSNWVSDSEFIKGKIQYSYPVFGQSKELFPKDFSGHFIEITRKDTGESRTYLPVKYAELQLHNFFDMVDSIENYNQKMLTLNNAKFVINKLVGDIIENDSHNLTLGKCTDKYDSHNFNKVYKRLNDRIEYLRVHNEFENSIVPISKNTIDSKIVNNKKSIVPKNKNYSHRQITIAYFCMDIQVTSENAMDILKKHSQLKSIDKLLQKRITTTSQIINLSENKTTDTKNLQDLKEAKRLISGIKNTEKAITEIDGHTSTFKLKYTNFYENLPHATHTLTTRKR